MFNVLLARQSAGPQNNRNVLAAVGNLQLLQSLLLEVIPQQVEAAFVVTPSPLQHPVDDNALGSPAVDVNFVATHVEDVRLLEIFHHILINSLKDLVHSFAGRIQLAAWRLYAKNLPRLGFEANCRVVANLLVNA